MSVLSDNLAKLESRLQILIEQSAVRFLPIEDPRANFGEKVVNSIGSSIQNDLAGDMIAPDLFILVVDPDLAQILGENPALMDEMSSLIQQAGIDAGLRFQKPPRIKIRTEDSLKPGTIRVLSYFSHLEVDETEIISLDSDGENHVPKNAFLIIDGVNVYPLTLPVVHIGRRMDNHIVIEDLRVSRLHAQFRAKRGHYQIFDLGSSGGTFVNGVRLTQATLYPGDVISLAGMDLIYSQDLPSTSGNDLDATQPLIPFSQG